MQEGNPRKGIEMKKSLVLSKETIINLTAVRGGAARFPITIDYTVCDCPELKPERVQ
jgi:hypothetical protein